MQSYNDLLGSWSTYSSLTTQDDYQIQLQFGNYIILYREPVLRSLPEPLTTVWRETF
jgi:hypothetical protein